MSKLANNVLFGIDRVVLGSLGRLLWANRKVNTSLRQVREKGLPDNDNRLNLPSIVIEEAYNADKQRLERIEDKAKNNVFAVAIAISVLTAGIGFYGKGGPLANQCVYMRGTAALLLAVAMVFLLLCAVLSLVGYKTAEVYHPDLEDRAELSGDRKWLLTLLQCLELNRKIIIIRSNYLTASMNCLVNGATAVAFFFLLILLSIL
jgi:hypothetical protein